MTLFKSWKKQKLVISDVDPTYKVKYLGNVQTALMKGDGCVDKPTGVLWNNYLKNGQTVGLDMTLTVCGSGLKALTKEQGLTEYRSHRISYCIAHPSYPKLFVWVYRHEGKKMKVELRCHAVLLKTDPKAKLLAVQLHDKLSFALNEFMRDKTRRQNTRLALQRTNSCPTSSSGITGAPMRTKFLNTAHHFKPSVDQSSGAPKLGAISEGLEEEEEEEELDSILGELEEEEDENEASFNGPGPVLMKTRPSLASIDGDQSSISGDTDSAEGEIVNGLFRLEMGNDIEALKKDLRNAPIDSDAESSESGFSEQGEGSHNHQNGMANGNAAFEHSSNHDASPGGHMTGGLANGVLTDNISNNNSSMLTQAGTSKCTRDTQVASL